MLPFTRFHSHLATYILGPTLYPIVELRSNILTDEREIWRQLKLQ